MLNNIRVCLLSSDYLPNTGGIAAHVSGLAGGLANAGCEVTVIVPGATRYLTHAGVLQSKSPKYEVLRPRVWCPHIIGRLWFTRGQVHLIRRIATNKTFDVFHWHTPLRDSDIASRVHASLKVFTNHSSQFLEWELQKKDRAQAKRSLVPADVVICPSDELVDATVSAGFTPEKVFFIPNGVDPGIFNPEVNGQLLRGSKGINENEVVILCPRRLETKNGVTFWIKAIPSVLAALKDTISVKFILAGDSYGSSQHSDRNHVVNLINELHLSERLLWVGSIPPHEMPRYMAAADVVVLPSLIEATSIAGLEAMACAKPLIGTKVGGIPYIIKDGLTGIIVPPADSEALAKAMIILASNREARLKMGGAARDIILKEFSWDGIGRKTIEVYMNSLEKKQKKISINTRD